jgi:LSD1 subclass zinc finger protein
VSKLVVCPTCSVAAQIPDEATAFRCANCQTFVQVVTPEQAKRRAEWSGTAIGIVILIVVAAFLYLDCGSFWFDDTRSAARPAAPEPSSDADRYCDTGITREQALAHDPTGGEDTVRYGFKWYSIECLDRYSWEADG